MRVMTVYGTRPEAIKVAPVIKALEADPRFESIVVVTGQHREMLDQVNDVFQIRPDHDLNVYEAGLALNQLMARMFERLDPVLEQHRPDCVLVQGDTSTVAAAAIAAFYRGVPVVHLEAGLRSGNIQSPFPEEANRRLVTQLAALHLTPTARAKQNLWEERVPAKDVVVTGNTVIDALMLAVKTDREFSDRRLAEAVATDRPILLVTTHRRENWDDMGTIGLAVREIADAYPNFWVIMPLHRNPKVRDTILPIVESASNVIVTDPLPYGEFTALMKASHIILTDSGGVQEEAPSLGKPVLLLRANTERPEAVEAGSVRLVGTDKERIKHEFSRIADEPEKFQAMANAVNPYGDGQAALRTVAAISQLLGQGFRLPDFEG